MADFIAMANRFNRARCHRRMDCVYSSWAADQEPGFADTRYCRFAQASAAACACGQGEFAQPASRARWSRTYLGRDAGRRVLAGGIARGVAERIETVLWFSDLRSYTRITDTSAPEHIIPLLNDYAEAVISAIHAQGGDVLKLIGDGTLAIFAAADHAAACGAALSAAIAAKKAVAELNGRRRGKELPATDMYLALHFGEVFYGNIGSKERLDFTVVGPAVNEVSRTSPRYAVRSNSRSFCPRALAPRPRNPPGFGRPLRATRRQPAAESSLRSIRRRRLDGQAAG